MSSLTKGLVGHWDFAPENVDGGVVRDRTAYGNHGSPDGGVVYKTAGPTGAAVDVDGTGMIECGTNALDADAIVDQVSVAAWFNFRTLSGNNRAICGQASSGQNDSYRLLVRNGELVLYIDDGGSVKIRTDAISTDVWHHAVGTFVDGSARLYLDGQLVVSQDGAGESISSSPSPFTIGARGGGGDHYADGQIADVRAYNRALSAKEVRRLYNTRDHGEGQQGSGLSGIVAHWPLNDSGSVAKDVVGENDGAIEGGVTTGVNTPAGAGMSFDGSSGYVSCADHDLSPADLEQVSMCGWIRYDSLSNARNSLFGLGSASENDVYRVWMTGSSVEFYLDGSGNPYVSTPIPSSSTWHHIGVVYGEGEQSIYINGKLQATSSAEAGMSASTAEFAIGARGGGQNFWDGDIADVRVYNRALTPEEIRSIYDQGLPVPESGLVGWWTLDESDISGSTAIDRSPNGNDGSINGSPGSADSPIGEALDVLPEEWVDTGLSPVIDDGDAQTIAIWAKKDEQDGTEWFFGDRGDPFYEIGFRNGSIQFYIKDDPGNTKNTDAGGFEAGVWYHNVVVVDKQDDVIQHYVNGELKDEVAIPVIGSNPTSVSGTLRIGSRYSATSYLDGKVSDTRIYDRALSEKEIRALYETRDPYYRNTAGSVTKRPTIITGTTQSLWTPRMLGEDLNFLADAYSPSPNTKVSDPDGDGTGESHGIKDLSGRRCGAESVNKAEWIPPQTSTLGGWEFDGEDDYYKKPENPSKSLTFGSVVRLNQTSSGQNADSETRLYADDTNGTFSIIRCYTGGNGVIGSYYKTGTNNEFTTAYSGWGEWHLLLHRAEPNGINELWIDGEIIGSVTTGSPGTANTKSAHLGTGRSGGNHNVDARIAHVLELREFASASQIDRWFGWAAHRYGLTGKLPSGHPYKSAPPEV